MSSDHDEQVRVLFEQAVELDRVERSVFLDRINRAPRIVTEVRALLSALDENTKFLEQQWFDPSRIQWDGLMDDDPDSGRCLLGQRIDSYQLQMVLGAGGLGTVYRAEQEKTKRMVALKMIRCGVHSTELRRRFKYDISLLGRLRHPGIAQILDSGIVKTSLGVQPYFAMDFVEGTALLEFARRRRLGSRERIELFAEICDAVQHAHQKGVIHGDLKPGKILVEESGQPKIIGFGLARGERSGLLASTAHPAIGHVAGITLYMSPEQMSADGAELDTRSDVYSLGVVLYVLLTGALPYDLQGKFIHEIVRVVKEGTPIALGAQCRDFRGDVEAVVGKALAKERSRRYSSVGALADDLRRALRNEPISVRLPSTIYQLKKLGQRNMVLMVSVAVGLLALMIGLATTSYFYWDVGNREHNAQVRLVRMRQLAASARGNEARARANEAKARTNESRAIADLESAHRSLEELTLRADIYRLQELLDRANALWPPYPERANALGRWLEHADELLSRRPLYERKLMELQRASRQLTVAGPVQPDSDENQQLRAIEDHLANLESFAQPNGQLVTRYGLNHGVGIVTDSDGAPLAERNVYWGLREAVLNRLNIARMIEKVHSMILR